MGSGLSQEEIKRRSFEIYQLALNEPCLFPDVGIDESLLRYSGLDSNAALQAYSNNLVSTVPSFIKDLGSSLSSFTSVPNAVGLGALVLSIIMELCKMSTSQQPAAYGLLRRVFGEEKASSVRDTMSEYVKRHQIYMNREPLLLGELQRLEKQLSNHLTILRNSLLLDGQMSTRGFKIWVNGAFFHVQMMIHEARLSVGEDEDSSAHSESIKTALLQYGQDLDRLLQKYKTFKISKTKMISYFNGAKIKYGFPDRSYLENTETGCRHVDDRYDDPSLIEGFVDHILSTYEPIAGLKNHFLGLTNNIDSQIQQHDSFQLPQA